MFHAGQQIGVYVLIERLGKGGFGEVWLAEKRSGVLTKKVAIKLPHEEHVNLEAIRQEALLWEQVSKHENVLTIFDADIYDGQVAIISEYAEGGSLADKLKRDGKLPVEQAVEMTIGILRGLDHLHSKQIVHRDIKPQNILLQGKTPRLADFGISRAMNTSNVSSVVIGTDSFMAPEAFDGARNMQTDIWSVGVLLYQLLKGSLPFPQQYPAEKMLAIVTKDFEPLPDNVPIFLKSIVKQALSKEPAKRFQTAEAMRKALDTVLTHLRNPAFAPTKAFSIPPNFDKDDSILTKVPFIPPPNYEAQPTQASPLIQVPIAPPNDKQGGIIIERKMVENMQFADKPSEAKIQPDKKKALTTQRQRIIASSIVLGIILLLIIIIYASKKDIISNNANAKITVPTATKTASTAAANLGQNKPITYSAELSDKDYYDKGKACEDNKNYDCAITNYSKAIDLNPQSYWYRYYRGIVYNIKSNYDQAINDFNKAIELNPDFYNPYSGRCVSYYYKSNYDQVITDCTKAISLGSTESSSYCTRGLAYNIKGLYDLALTDTEKAVGLNSSSQYNYNARGLVYENKKYLDLAATDFRKALSIDPDFTMAKNNLDRVLKKKEGE